MDERTIEITIKDKENALALLHSECVSKADELDSLNDSISVIKEEVKQFEKDKKDFAIWCENERTSIALAKDELITAQKAYLTEKINQDKVLQSIRDSIRSANKELSKVNDMVLKAREENEQLAHIKSTLEGDNAQLRTLISAIPELKEEVVKYEAKRNESIALASNALEASTQELILARNELEILRSETEHLISQRNNAQYELKKYLDELETRKKDFNIMRNRLEFVFNEKYPELKLII